MPLYEYKCKKCGHVFERIQKFSDPHVKKCPDCGGSVEQVVSAPAVQFKGSGWYVTDYAKGGSSAGSSNGESSKDSEKRKDEKKESKAKSENKSSESSSSSSNSSRKTEKK